jgi:hypothetical protein
MPYSPQRGGYKSGLPSELSEYSATGGRRRTRRARRSMRGGWADAFASPIGASASTVAAAIPDVASHPVLANALASNNTAAISQALSASPAAVKSLVNAANGSGMKAAAASAVLAKPAVAAAVAAHPALSAQQKASALAASIAVEKGAVGRDWTAAGADWKRDAQLKAEWAASPAAYAKRVAAIQQSLHNAPLGEASHIKNLATAVKYNHDHNNAMHVDAGKHAMALQRLTGSPAGSFLPGVWGKEPIPLKGGARRRSRSRSASRKSRKASRRHRR